MNWRRWLNTPTHPDPATALPPATSWLRLYADCGRARFDDADRLIAVACPAVLCGSVTVADNRIREHLTWDARPCPWSGWRIVDDRVGQVVS